MAKRLPAAPPALAGYSYSGPLGVGGFADVFKFEQNMPRRSVAVKVLLQSVVDADVIRMFNAEADVMAKLSAHPSILTVYDASISSDGRPFMVVELCPGSMGTRYRREKIPVAEILNIGIRMASALGTAHAAGLLHRDIKPSNILITTFGAPVLADFGIAGSISESQVGDTIALSIPWSAPEVIEERTSGTVASEVWSLGATLYTLLAGRTPFEVDDRSKNTGEHLSARISRAKYVPVPRSDVPERLQLVLARALSRDPSARQATMVELATELQYVQFELGLALTPIEVAAAGWNADAQGVDFDDSAWRGPTITTVAHESARQSQTATRRPAAAVPDHEGILTGAPPRRRRSLAPVFWVAGVIVVLAIGSLVAALVIGGMH